MLMTKHSKETLKTTIVTFSANENKVSVKGCHYSKFTFHKPKPAVVI